MEMIVSIRPEYVEEIASGEKTWEYRKSRPKAIPERIWVYETRPTKHIVGYLIVDKILEDTPNKVFDQTGKEGKAGSRQGFLSYYRGYGTAYAWHIKEYVELAHPINPYSRRDFRPPVSWGYFDITLPSKPKKRQTTLTEGGEVKFKAEG
jgi:predicted transcriptional regulator